MIKKERRPSKKNSKKENKKYPYKKHRKEQWQGKENQQEN